ncbi:MAG: hypothetical protein OEZ68_08305 [Gammaproteobacteria bacterium]|nr:hypothetical protein [Gammaproteobacteria bacterium]MDH5800790.1 hypothetical protein [Gammaproteobacteria bacterium]
MTIMRLLFVFGFLLLSACGEDEKTYTPLSVEGQVRYEDKEYSSNGFTGERFLKPVRFARVELVSGNGRVLDRAVADENGFYSLRGGAEYMYVRVLAFAEAQTGSTIEVRNHSGELYAMRQSVDSAGGDPVNLDMDITSDHLISGAFNILDVYLNATGYISGLSTQPMPPLRAFWQPQSNRYGTYFCSSSVQSSNCPQGAGVYLLGGYQSGGDTDEYDDDVLYHEFGHYLESALGILHSPGGRHYISENDSDIRLAWSEGFGGFMPGAVKSWLRQNDSDRLSIPPTLATSYFIDTSGSYAAISLDMAAPSTMFCSMGKDCFVYSTSEVSVAKILNQLDAQFGSRSWWDTVVTYMAANNRVATLETFWDGWMQHRFPGSDEMALVQGIFQDRQVFYIDDSFENDSTLPAANTVVVCEPEPCTTAVRTLYGVNGEVDMDLFRFDAVAGSSYTVETLGLSNGADTFIRILDANGNLVLGASGEPMQNNDRPGTVYCYPFDSPCRVHNDATMLSSVLTFQPLLSAPYWVQISTNPNRPAAAGRYGSYQFKITRN